tara:strand:- start:886 stop:1662 length:777 start_codon:yes stop_codon:yes gene_type:complete
MGRIPDNELKILKEIEQECLLKKSEYLKFKKENMHIDTIESAFDYLAKLFSKFTIFEPIMAEKGELASTSSDTHYRGRDLEACLGGSFDGKPLPDFDWGELKCIETKSYGELVQVITCGTIFSAISKPKGEYTIPENYYHSNFYKKMKDAILIGYLKKGKQLGCIVNSLSHFSINNPKWEEKLKEDWESISSEMVSAIEKFKRDGEEKASGICKSDTNGTRRPHGLLGIRSDGVIITKKFFREITGETSSRPVLYNQC